MSEVREACRELLDNKEFDDIIKGWILDGEFDDEVIERATALMER